jgi:O-antigen/teichoic acid export membrane protein
VRDLDYKGITFIEALSQIVITLAAVPMCRVVPDFRSILYLLIVKSAIILFVSFVLAQRTYRWCWDAAHIRRMAVFGWPLFVNGMLMFGIMEGDRIIIALGYTMSDLGGYSVACQLTFVPGFMFLEIISRIMLPVLSRLQDKRDEFYPNYEMCFRLSGFISMVLTVFIILCGENLVILFFGKKYADLGMVLNWLAMANAMRLLRTAPTMAALALGDTKNNMYSNFVRAIGLLFGLVVVLLKLPLWALAVSCFIAEVCSLSFSLVFLSYKYKIDIGYIWNPVLFLVVSIGAAAAFTSNIFGNLGMLGEMILALVAFAAITLLNVFLQRQLRVEAVNLVRQSGIGKRAL